MITIIGNHIYYLSIELYDLGLQNITIYRCNLIHIVLLDLLRNY